MNGGEQEPLVHALIIDDSRDDARILQRHLSRCRRVMVETGYAADLQQALAKLAGEAVDIIFLDNRLGGGVTARDVLESFRGENIDIPVVIFTGQGDEQTAVELMKAGAYDYIVKDNLTTELLEKSILNTIERYTLKAGQARSEKEMKSLNEELEATVEKLTSSNRELQDFAHVMAHDLKAPLRAITTLADWISTGYNDKLDRPGQEQVKLLIARAERMSRLIDGILEYSKVRHTREKAEEVDLSTLLTEVIRSIGPPENIRIEIVSELPRLICERTRIMQVFRNLLSNAIKYMDKPQGQISIGCVEEDDFWRFSVADNGPGIEEKYFEKIFRIFQTLAPRDEIEGTGIGLTIANKIVESYGGKIWVESRPGEASTFFFTLSKQKTGDKDAKLEAEVVSRR